MGICLIRLVAFVLHWATMWHDFVCTLGHTAFRTTLQTNR